MSEKVKVDEISIEGVTYVPKDSVFKTLDKPLDSLEDLVGGCWFFRTVTHHVIGRVEKIINNKYAVLSGGVWIADTPRFMDFIREGKLDEVEPTCDNHVVNIEATADFMPWKHPLPTEQK